MNQHRTIYTTPPQHLIPEILNRIQETSSARWLDGQIPTQPTLHNGYKIDQVWVLFFDGLLFSQFSKHKKINNYTTARYEIHDWRTFVLKVADRCPMWN